jgi:4a-hydroxytetrahydrobiopterin dehydratase
MTDERLKRLDISGTAGPLGWRLILGELQTQVPAGSLAEAAGLAQALSAVDSGDHLRMDIRPDRLYLSLTTPSESFVTPRDLELARTISGMVTELGSACHPEVGDRPDQPDGPDQPDRPVQRIEIGIDALDIAAVRPFWRAVLGYGDEPGRDGPDDAIVDPAGQGPSVWFQQMDAPRPQRNRIHFDVVVPHDQARRRMDAAIAAGGRVTYDAEAPAFWVLADPEGNEACICTWQARDVSLAAVAAPPRCRCRCGTRARGGAVPPNRNDNET